MKSIWTLSLALLLSACLSSNNDPTASGGAQPTPVTPAEVPTVSKFSIANQCYGLQSVFSRQYIKTSGNRYTAAPATEAESFTLRPASLGNYLIYGRDKQMVTAQGSATTASAEPTDAAIWKAEFDDKKGVFRFFDASGKLLALDETQGLVLTGTDSEKSQFKLMAANNCTAYPEMPTGMVGKPYPGKGEDQPIIGFADTHTHMGMSSEMSLKGDVGPSAGGVLYGEVIHRFGVPHALKDCADFHGPNGIRDANNILEQNPTGTHDTKGWPTFVDWPRRNFLTHQVMYHAWVERAWRAGLRLMVIHGTNIAALCRVGQLYANKPEADCTDMGVATKQVKYLYDIQDYVDAQFGGPGQGWFRIVKSPAEARKVTNQGKLAVVPGIEVAQVFNCGVTILPDGTEQRKCDEQSIDAEIEKLWALGVRHVYPFHDIDSALGGAGIFSGDVINFLNFLDTGAFWKTTECRAYPKDEPSVREPGTKMTTAVPGTGSDPLTKLLFDAVGGKAPVYPDGIRCNARTVTDLGMYALKAIMKKGFVIDIDHAEYHSKDIMLDLAEKQTPAYPMASSHDAHGGLTSDQAIRMLKDGGVIYPYKGNGIKHKEFLQKLKFWRQKAGVTNTPIALGYGADANGFGGHPGPRGGNSKPVQYPFTLFRGADWGPRYQSLPAMQVNLLTIPESGKFWHIDEVGMAHYGLVADFVEEVRLESGSEGLDALYNSAEAYVRMWENVYYRANPR
ncbi:MAG TPA: peptidase M19 [Limnobacter sp.]|uniref:peptidase M19 n=1 Tax=Limnobacter sp. TaxID=2003368 RepID=UPI002EDB893A